MNHLGVQVNLVFLISKERFILTLIAIIIQGEYCKQTLVKHNWQKMLEKIAFQLLINEL
jgi:hypothetical protein